MIEKREKETLRLNEMKQPMKTSMGPEDTKDQLHFKDEINNLK